MDGHFGRRGSIMVGPVVRGAGRQVFACLLVFALVQQ